MPPVDPQALMRGGSLVLTRPTMGDFLQTPEERAWRYRELFDAVMRRQNISRLDVEEALRDNGLGKVSDAALITLEVDGTITVIPRK